MHTEVDKEQQAALKYRVKGYCTQKMGNKTNKNVGERHEKKNNLEDVKLIDFLKCLPSRQEKREAEHVKLCYLIKSSAELQPSVWKGGGGSEEVLHSTNRLVLLHCSLQSV